ncbi:CaiB/BaiF CoA transferase family protein [Actinomycetospora termitidis]|uniref:CoA transferase n=1 Tax=Actinomycetospora termitidis TaxID=3053470 RepID=A0ABT7MDZ0_9PSEU|nr:CoA transferase [Actinomycetospora sp. Odt1-22]MDL5158885.1 CoA transferase [Actinomycetospora sp. Odt1-22]
MAGPYAGLRVFDLSHVIAGPFCTRMLADLGADVIRVEQPAGDLMRALPVAVGDPADHLSSAYAQYNCGKRSIGLNLKDDRGRELALELADWADVVVENFAPGALDRLGLGWDVLHARDPRTILCSLSTFGTEGPYAHLSGFGLVAEAYSGLMSLTGSEGGPPMHFGTALADVNSAVHGLAAIGAALHHRERTGEGTHADVSAFDSLFAMIDQQPAAGAFTDGEAVRGRYGNRHTTSVPSGVATCADGTHLAYGMAGDVFFARLVTAMDATDLAERYGAVAARVADPGPLYDRIEAWAATWSTADALVEHLVAHGLSAARVRGVRENLADPHLIARGTLSPVEFPGHGEVLLPTAPFRFSGAEVRPGAPPGAIAADSDAVLHDVLHLDDGAVDALFDDGVVHGPTNGRTR